MEGIAVSYEALQVLDWKVWNQSLASADEQYVF